MEYGIRWHPSKESLLLQGPGPVIVGTSYEYQIPGDAGPLVRQARKYASFDSHFTYFDCIMQHEKYDRQQNLHEVFVEDSPRCLYFDLDGEPGYKTIHSEIITWLRLYVRWAFCGDRLGWDASYPNEVVLTSANPSKYSCHVVFPQIQFADHAQQGEFMHVLLNALPAFKVDLEGGESVPILQQVVDRQPYSKFQLFRGPYAAKLASGELRRETRLEPEGFFRSDPLACFAGRTVPEYALELPPVARLLEWNEDLRHLMEQRASWSTPGGQGGLRPMSSQDALIMYDSSFQLPSSTGIIDLAGMTPIEQYENALQRLHPGRASQWWSWFRISGVTFKMLEKYGDDEVKRNRIWRAHFEWSRHYPSFDQEENVRMVMQSRGRRVSGLPLLFNLLQFDNPGMQVRTSTWNVPLGGTRWKVQQCEQHLHSIGPKADLGSGHQLGAEVA